MANMKALRDRIQSIEQTMKITNAMYLISSVKVRKARQQLEAVQPYFEKMQETIGDILRYSPEIQHPYFDRRPEVTQRKRGYIVISADKSLSGSYNHNLMKRMEALVHPEQGDRIFMVGNMGRSYCRQWGIPFEESFLYATDSPTRRRAGEICQVVLEQFLRRRLDEVYVLFTRWHSSIQLEPELLELLPLDRSRFEESDERPAGQLNRQVVYQPSADTVLDFIIPNSMRGEIYSALVESFSCEQSARVTAMDNATNNAKEMIAHISRQYNQARQAAITQEISEVVGGASAAGQ